MGIHKVGERRSKVSVNYGQYKRLDQNKSFFMEAEFLVFFLLVTASIWSLGPTLVAGILRSVFDDKKKVFDYS